MKPCLLHFIPLILLFVGCNTISPGNPVQKDNSSSSTQILILSSSAPNLSSPNASSNPSSSSSAISLSSAKSSSSSTPLNKDTLALVLVPKDSVLVGKLFQPVPSFLIQAEVLTVGAIRKTSWNNKFLKLADTARLTSLNWNEALLICNALSKLENRDTVYSYYSIDGNGAFYKLRMDPTKNGYRLPTIHEWSLAQRKYTSAFNKNWVDQEWLLESDLQNPILSKLFTFPVVWDSTGIAPKIIISREFNQFGSAGTLTSLAGRGFRVLRRP